MQNIISYDEAFALVKNFSNWRKEPYRGMRFLEFSNVHLNVGGIPLFLKTVEIGLRYSVHLN